MNRIVFLSSWVGDGTMDNPIRCKAIDLWQSNNVEWRNLRDAGQQNVIPDPNVCAWECDAVSDAGVSLLEANPSDYYILVREDA